MATLKTIRKRIISVRNTQKITKAMKMVAAAKLRRAQTRLTNARPYTLKVEELLSHLASLVEGTPHSIFERRERRERREAAKAAEFLILTSDRGLCGGFNGNLLRRVEEFLKEKGTTCPEVRISVVGRKGRDFFRARKREPAKILTGLGETMTFESCLKIAEELISGYRDHQFDEFYLVYNYFRSAISQEIRIDPILPLKVTPVEAGTYLPEYLYEPSRGALLERLIPRVVAAIIHRAFLESTAGEYGARMVAMENATNNSSDMIHKLTLQMNRLRQAAITKELMDIVNGAESLKKQ